MDRAQAQREKETRSEARTHPHHAHAAKARRGADRWRLAVLGDPRPDLLPRTHSRYPNHHRQRRHPALSGRARWQVRAGRAASALGLPGLALSRRQRVAARSVARGPRRRQDAGTDAARIARARIALNAPLTFPLLGFNSMPFAWPTKRRHDALLRLGGPVRRLCASRSSLRSLRKLEDGAPGRRRALSPEGSRVAPDARRVSPNPPKGASPAPWRRPGAPFPVWGSGKGKQAPPRLQRTGAMTLA